MSNMALEEAWLVLKAPAREAIPDSNIHFVTQYNRGDRRYKGPEGNMLSSHHFQGRIDDNEVKRRKTPIKLPQVTHAQTPEEPMEDIDLTSKILHMTPRQFLRLTGREGMDYSKLGHYLKPMKEAMRGGEPARMNMPTLTITGVEHLDEPGDMRHDGRHRMASLISLGHGDTPVPVHVRDYDAYDQPFWEPPEETEMS